MNMQELNDIGEFYNAAGQLPHDTDVMELIRLAKIGQGDTKRFATVEAAMADLEAGETTFNPVGEKEVALAKPKRTKA